VLYHFYEWNMFTLCPARAAADASALWLRHPFNPLAHTTLGRNLAAGCELFERSTRRYARPVFDISETSVAGRPTAVTEKTVWRAPFCNLLHFERDLPPDSPARSDTRILVVAPLSGHFSTLLRGTVEALLPHHDVYLTEWLDARQVPMAEGSFDLDDYIDYLIRMIRRFEGDVHVMAVCQPAVPVLAAVSLMEARGEAYAPKSMILMAGPIDTRVNPTAVNALAERKGLDWFKRTVITRVPWPHPGFMRPVYPGFLQLNGFMQMNLDRHLQAHKDLFDHLVAGDGDSAAKHREFYDEYLAVMDLTAEFYLQTIETVFLEHHLPMGSMVHRNERVNPGKITRTALLTIEGEKDDISGRGQTAAAHDLCVGLPDEKKQHYEQPDVGHYGTFNGSRFRSGIRPRITAFTESQEPRRRIGERVRALFA
jgi:poly(3-hydroxybutyrate) depolymerase